MGRCTSEDNMQGLRKKEKQITVQSISLTMTSEANMEGDTAWGKMRTNTSKGNMHGIQTVVSSCCNSVSCSFADNKKWMPKLFSKFYSLAS